MNFSHMCHHVLTHLVLPMHELDDMDCVMVSSNTDRTSYKGIVCFIAINTAILRNNTSWGSLNFDFNFGKLDFTVASKRLNPELYLLDNQ